MSATMETLGTEAPLRLERWPSEETLFVFSLIAGLGLWVLLIISIVGAVYAAFFAVFFALMQLMLVGYVRGSAIRLGPEQFPELHAAVERIARRLGMKKVPEAYIMQAGGALNAFATRFLMANMIVLYSDLLEACGDDVGARDMIIGHELAHVRLGHLRWRLLLAPSLIVPFLGLALSRAREYSCDRYGAALAGPRDSAVLGLCILAGGARFGRLLNRAALVRQREAMNTGWMTLAEWFGTHPPLSKRIAAIEPSLTGGRALPPTGPLRAALGIFAVFALGFTLVLLGMRSLAPAFRQAFQQAQANAGATAAAGRGPAAPSAPLRPFTPAEERAARTLAVARLDSLATILRADQARRALPVDEDELWTAWQAAYPRREIPVDPFDGHYFGYERDGASWLLWSSGPDRKSGTADDIQVRGE